MKRRGSRCRTPPLRLSLFSSVGECGEFWTRLGGGGQNVSGNREAKHRRSPSRDDGLTRRDVLKIGGTAALAAFAGSGIQEALGETRKKFLPVVMVWLEGGADPWRTVMPLSEKARGKLPEEFRGPFGTIPTTMPGVTVSEHFPRLATNLKEVSFLRSVTSGSTDHFVSQDCLLLEGDRTLGDRLGNQNTDAELPYGLVNMEGRYQNDTPTITSHRPDAAMQFVWEGGQKRIPKPELTGDPAISTRREILRKLENFESSAPIVRRMEENRERAFNLLTGKPRFLEAFDIPSEELKRFGDLDPGAPNQLAHAAALASRLAQRGVAFTTIHHCERQGWDMHQNLKEELPILAGHLDIALAELIRDAREHGFIVVCTSEFGRTPKMNSLSPTGGSDHDEVHFMIGAEGAFQKGVVYGDYTRDGKISDHLVRNEDLGPTIIRAAGGVVRGMNKGIDAIIRS